MANEGYIKLYRKMMKWGWYTDTNTKCVFLHLLFMACYEPYYVGHTFLEPGQVVTTIKEISEGTGISVRSVRTSLDKLKSTNELTIKTSNKNSLITINNYSDYQGIDKPSDKQLTNDRQTTDKQLTNDSYIKEGKEGKEGKEVIRAKKFCPPTLEEIKAYCRERSNLVDPEKFFDYYEANGWVQGKGKPVKDWKACVRTWERSGFNQTLGNKNQKETYTEHGAYW